MSSIRFAAIGFALALAGCAANNDSEQSAAQLIAPTKSDRMICIVSSEESGSAMDVMARQHLQSRGYIVKLAGAGGSTTGCRQMLWINVSESPIGAYQPRAISVEWKDGYTGERRRASWRCRSVGSESTLLTAGCSDDPQAVLNRLLDNLFIEAGRRR